jgi:hypothetical protein
MAALIGLLPAAGHDQMWLLYAARLLRHGVPLYGPEIFETNPPMMVWLSTIPSAAADLLHLPDTAVGKFLVLGLEVIVAFVCLRLLRRLAPVRDGAMASVLNSASLAWLPFVYIAVFAVMPARDFGQRDHLLALLCLPYVLAAALDADPDRNPHGLSTLPATLIGVAALLGLALKPHQLLIPIAVESTLIVLRRGHTPTPFASLLRPEFLAMLASGLVFLAAVHSFAANYLAEVVPIARDAYWAFGQSSFPHLVGEALQLHVLAVVTLGLFLLEGPRRAPAAIPLLLAAGCAGLVAYYLQGTGWYYQQLPALSFFALALALLLAGLVRRRGLAMPRWAPNAAFALSLLTIGLTAYFAGLPFTAERSFPIDTPDASFFLGLAPGTPVTTITTTVDYVMPPIFKYNLTLAQRYPHLWMLPAILRSEDPEGGPLKRHLSLARVAQLDAFQHAAMREDLQRWRPRLILVERCQDPAAHCQALEDRHDNLLAWFLSDPATQGIFTHYHYLRSSGRFDAYIPN